MRLLTTMMLLATAPFAAGASADKPVPQDLWPGTVPLAELTCFRVVYQVFGQAPVVLPPAQYGDEGAGAVYQPRADTIFMHPAWKKGAGWTAVEYFIRLPAKSPIRLRFAAGLDPMAAPRSDGITFRVYLGTYRSPKVVWEKHITATRSEDVEIDLTPFAGSVIILGLRVHPGPAKSTAYDWANWYDAVLVVGSGQSGRKLSANTCRRLRHLARYGLAPFLNNPASAMPSAGPMHTRNEVRRSGPKRWSFIVRTDEQDAWNVTYIFDFSDGRLSGLRVRAPDGRTWQPCRGGGMELTIAGRHYTPDDAAVQRSLLDVSESRGRVTARYRYSVAGHAVAWAMTVSLRGPYLEIQATAPPASQGISGFSWGRPYGFRLGRGINVPYLYWGNVWQIGDGFLAAVPDLWSSNASAAGRSRVTYRPRSDGRYNALGERLWVGYVPVLEMALHNIPHPRSPYFEDMASRPVVDIWGGTFDEIRQRLLRWAEYGVDHAFIIIHNWQRAGYDVQYPDVIPANAGLGGDQALRRLCQTANAIGHRIAVHENYVDFYPDAPSFNPDDVALNSAGKWVKAYLHPATHIQSFLLKPLRALKYARRFAPEIHRRYGTSGAYLDVHTAVAAWGKVDYDARVPDAGKFAATWRAYRELFDFMRRAHGGPLTGEGGNHAYWAGLFDGAEAQVVGGENVQPLVLYDLLKVHPLNVNHGMGYWSRWAGPHPDLPTGTRMVLPILEDKYRAQELTFGHAGFIGTERTGTDRLVVREYYLTRWLQPLAAGAMPRRVEVQVGNEFVSLSEAILAMQPLERLHIVYDSGLELWVNWGRKTWQVAGYSLPQWGYLARATNLLQYCAMRSGVVADFMQGPDAIFADARPAASDILEQFFFNVRPAVENFEDLGGGRFRLTYLWKVLGTTSRNLHVFVHFTRPEIPGIEHIGFQNDHAPPKPTNQWRPGETIRDGPYTVTIPEAYRRPGRIGVRLGLYDDAGRVSLGVAMTGRTRCHVGDIIVHQDGGRIRLRFEPANLQPIAPEVLHRAVSARMNTGHKLVDFGPLITDGCVILRPRRGRLALIIVPRGASARVGLRPSHLPPAWRNLPLPSTQTKEGGILWVKLR